jgi:hypothetical protein
MHKWKSAEPVPQTKCSIKALAVMFGLGGQIVRGEVIPVFQHREGHLLAASLRELHLIDRWDLNLWVANNSSKGALEFSTCNSKLLQSRRPQGGSCR